MIILLNPPSKGDLIAAIYRSDDSFWNKIDTVGISINFFILNLLGIIILSLTSL